MRGEKYKKAYFFLPDLYLALTTLSGAEGSAEDYCVAAEALTHSVFWISTFKPSRTRRDLITDAIRCYRLVSSYVIFAKGSSQPGLLILVLGLLPPKAVSLLHCGLVASHPRLALAC